MHLEAKEAAEAFWKEFTRNMRVMHFVGEISERSRTPTQVKQLEEARDYIRENFEHGAQSMAQNLFAEMRLDFDEDPPGHFEWLAKLLQEETLRPPTFPDVFTPERALELINRIYGAQTTVAATLEEIEPAYRKWLDYEARVRLIFKGACGLDKEWQTEGLFAAHYAEDMYRLVRRLGEYVATFKIRLEQLARAYDALSRIITVMEMDPAEKLSRKEPEERRAASAPFSGRRGFNAK